MSITLNTFNIVIGGEAGQGLVSVGNILLKAVAKEGWHLFVQQDYESRIRGGHNFSSFRLADQPVYCGQREIDLLVALDKVSQEFHGAELNDDSIVIYDPGMIEEVVDQSGYIGIAFSEVAKEQGQSQIMGNAVAAGAIWGLLSDDLTTVKNILSELFQSKGDDIVVGNIKCAQAGFNLVKSRVENQNRLMKPAEIEPRMILQGNEALPLGALAAGLKFMSAYPMTPATGVTEFIAANSESCSVVMEQVEDEISAINMAIGAAHTGVRAMTATSGGGFALMTEALGFAGAAEIPIVVINAQRPGPSTGLPTRTEQGDLLYAAATSSGDFPKAIFAPGDVEEAFYLMGNAFNVAEQFQIPVIVLSDQHLADSYQTVVPYDLSMVNIDRGDVVDGAAVDYLRYQYTDSGVSPRLYPGFGEGLVVSAGDEHDEEGHLIEDIDTRVKMMEKRMRKMTGIKETTLAPVTYGDEDSDLVLIGWGSSKGAIREAVDQLQILGNAALAVHLPQVYPLPDQLRDILTSRGKKFVVEGNYSGQLEKLIGMEFGLKPDGSVRKYDGRPFDAKYIVKQIIGGGK